MALALDGVAASRSTTLISQGPCVAMILPAKLYSSCRGSAPFGCKVGNLGIKSSGPSGKRYRSPSIVCEAKEITTVAGPVNDATFKKLVLDCELPVLVDFWAPWCGPCRMIDPVINELAERYAGKLRCFKLNTDESPQIATDYGIRSIPTIIIFKGGEKKDAVIGAVPKATLITTIEKFLDS